MFDFDKIKQTGSYLGRAARMLVGMPDYGTYVRHMQENHPDQPCMSYEEFFKNRIDARYGGGAGSPVRCC